MQRFRTVILIEVAHNLYKIFSCLNDHITIKVSKYGYYFGFKSRSDKLKICRMPDNTNYILVRFLSESVYVYYNDCLYS